VAERGAPGLEGGGTPAALDRLLQGSSRTFALTIPLLPEPTRCEATVAYLLFRVADSLEDSTLWPRARKLAGLEQFASLLDRPSAAETKALAARWREDPPIRHPGYEELLAEVPGVMRAAASLAPAARQLVARHTARTCRAMAAFVAREEDGALRLRDLDDLRAYCYAVAGIVGEMLTELFLLRGEPLLPIADELRRESAIFGEALQLVNILRDRADDAAEGRTYLPDGLDPASAFAIARADLAVAAGYCARLERAGADRGLVAFTALPVLLARATLDAVERRGAGAKISRGEVGALMARLTEALDRRAVGPHLEDQSSSRGAAP